MNNTIQTWNKLLEAAPEGSVLMGGAIRDWHFCKEAKDYDIFYSYNPGIPQIKGWTYKPRPHDAEIQAEYNINGMNGLHPIAAVYDYEVPIGYKYALTPKGAINLVPDQVKVQLIGVQYDNPVQHFANFDHTLVLGLFGLNTGLYISPKFFESIRNKSITCTNNSSPGKSLLRAKNAVNRLDPQGAQDWNFLEF